MTAANPVTLSPARRAALLHRGFDGHHGRWVSHGFLFEAAGPWLEIQTAWPDNADPLSAHLGKPGLWKPIRDGRRIRRVFAISEAIVRDGERDDAETGSGAFELVVDWALNTAAGTPPNMWTPPERAVVDALLPKSRLTIVQGSYARQVEIIQAPDRLALRVHLVPSLPANLAEYRLDCLRSLLLDEQDRHHLVRLGIARDHATNPVIAEIDLTGIPATLLEPMLSMSLDALRWVASRLVESVDFIAESFMASRALEICAAYQTQPKGENRT